MRHGFRTKDVGLYKIFTLFDIYILSPGCEPEIAFFGTDTAFADPQWQECGHVDAKLDCAAVAATIVSLV